MTHSLRYTTFIAPFSKDKNPILRYKKNIHSDGYFEKSLFRPNSALPMKIYPHQNSHITVITIYFYDSLKLKTTLQSI